jgi:ketosteroid isomerase-like protein
MRRLLIVLMVLLSQRVQGQVVAGRTTITLPDTLQLDAEGRAIMRLERGRSASIAAQDTSALRLVYSDDFRGIAANGMRIDRAILFGVFSRDDPRSTFTIDELTVRILDSAKTAAMLTGRLRTYRDGTLAGQSRYTHVYEKRAGGWRIVGAQASVVPLP